MDDVFIWYGSVAVIDILKADNLYDLEQYIITVKQAPTLQNKQLYCEVIINGIPYSFDYCFFSNILIAGNLTVTNKNTNEAKTFAFKRHDTEIGILFFESNKNYSDLYNYGNKNEHMVVHTQMVNHRKDYLSCTHFTKLSEGGYRLTVIKAGVNEDHRRLTWDVIKMLFAVSGAIDYDRMVCYDIVHLSNPSVRLIITSEADFQVIIFEEHPTNDTCGQFFPLNSDFKQYFEYGQTKDGVYELFEYVRNPDPNKSPIVKRAYEMAHDAEARQIVIPDRNMRFDISVSNINDLIIKKV